MSEEKRNAQYGDISITALKGADRVRKRPAVIFGSDGLEGCEHSYFEILSNAVDEAKEGHGDVITTTVWPDHTIEVEDRGRGVPLGWNEKEKRWNWDLIFCELYAGGKYDNNSGNAAYEYSLGLNGLGACATQYSSEFMEVTSFDGKNSRKISFKRGNPSSELIETPLQPREKRTGTIIKWRPDIKVFTDIAIPNEYFIDVLHRQSVVNVGITFVLRFMDAKGKVASETSYYYKNGIVDYLIENVGENTVTQPVLWHMETQGRDRADMDDYKVKADISFCISNTSTMLEYYHNSSYLEYGGSPDKAVRSAFLYEIDKYLKTNGKYNKNETKITFPDIADCLAIVINSQSTMTSYENQTKKAINNTFIYEALNDFMRQQLDIFFLEHPIESEAMANQVLINKRSREAADIAKRKIKVDLSGKVDNLANRVEKFVNCRSKDPNVRELYIVEGDSALTSCKLARNAEFQAIIPVRGKTLNCLKADYEKIFKSEIITDLLRVIGCGVEIEGKIKGDLTKFNYDQLKWSKIIICTDADEDGFQIRTLLLTLFYRLLPTLLANERVFIAETPLFEITTKTDKYFAYDEFEKADILRELGNTKYTMQRSKGLGENEPDMMSRTTMNPASRRLIAVTPTDAKQTEIMFETLLGDDLPARKVFIAEHGSQYVKDADI